MSDPAVMLIAGGSGSIGQEIAAQALAAGWAVIIHGRSDDSVDAAVDLLRQKHPKRAIAGISADIGDPLAAESLVDRAAAIHSGIDAVIDCVAAGPGQGRITGPFGDTDPAVYGQFMELSAVYLQRLAAAALPWLIKRRGCLVTFISDAGIYPAPRQALIGAARAASAGFIRNLALEIARDGIRAHCISLSFVEETEVAAHLDAADNARLARARERAGLGLPSPRDIAPLVLFLCGEGARHITGQIISVNGGLNT